MLVAASFFGGEYIVYIKMSQHGQTTHTHTTSQVLSTHLDASETVQPKHCQNAVFASSNTRPIKDVAPTKNKGAKAYFRKSQAWGRLHWDQTKMYFMECETMPWPHESGQFWVKKSLEMFNKCLVKIILLNIQTAGGFFSRMQAAHCFCFGSYLFSWEGVIEMNTPTAKSYTFVNLPNLFCLVVEETPALDAHQSE